MWTDVCILCTDFIITQIGGEFHSPTTTSKSTVTKLHTCISRTPLAFSKVGQNGLFMLREGLPVNHTVYICTKSWYSSITYFGALSTMYIILHPFNNSANPRYHGRWIIDYHHHKKHIPPPKTHRHTGYMTRKHVCKYLEVKIKPSKSCMYEGRTEVYIRDR